MRLGPWIIPIKVSPAAGHFCPDGGHQIYPNLSGFSDRPLDFREICPDSWIGLQNPVKNHQKSPKNCQLEIRLVLELLSRVDMKQIEFLNYKNMN